MTDSNDIIKNIPPAAPKWSVGIVTIIAALAASFMLLWGYVQPLIQKNLESNIELRNKQHTEESAVVDSLLSMVKGNQSQISTLASAITETQRANNNISERVTTLEKELNAAHQDITECEARLKNCKK